MAIHTTVNKEWSVRLLIITVAFTLFGFWFLYDWKVGYPEKQEKYETVFDASGVIYDDWEKRWADAGYPPIDNPNDLESKSESDIRTQFVLACVAFPVGLLSITWLLYHARRKPWVDEEGFKFLSTVIPLNSIKKIDTDLWKSKGIAVLHYDGEGGTGIFKLDDWKYKGADRVLEHIVEKTGLTGSSLVDEALFNKPQAEVETGESA